MFSFPTVSLYGTQKKSSVRQGATFLQFVYGTMRTIKITYKSILLHI